MQTETEVTDGVLEVPPQVDGGITTAEKKKRKKKKKKANADTTAEDAKEESTADNDELNGSEADAEGSPGDTAAEASKKKKKKKKKKGAVMPAQDNSDFRLLGDWKAVEGSRQTFPEPTKNMDQLYPDGHFPVGEIQEYRGSNAFRTTSEEMREKERLLESQIQDCRKAAECHRQVRKYLQSYARPGMKLVDIVQRLESKSHELVNAKLGNLVSGWGFPTGCSLNHVAAHYTPNYGDRTMLGKEDICKIDFGVQVHGRIMDCAFTMAFDPRFDTLIESTKDGTNVGIRASGIDARFNEIAAEIQETIESYEFISHDGSQKVLPIRSIKNLNGHSIESYQIHAGKSVPIVPNRHSEDLRMEEGEMYAIETFASTGKAYVIEDMECSHYMRVFDYQQTANTQFRVKNARQLLQSIDTYFGTLAFCRRWLDDVGEQRHLMALKSLCDMKIVEAYPPLCDIRGSFTSQMEHTILLKPSAKEVLTRGDDY